MEKSRKNIQEKMSGKTKPLYKMMEDPFSEKLKEIKEALKQHKNSLPLKDFAKEIQISEGGIRTIITSTQSQKTIKIFPVQKGKLEEYHIKLESI